MKLRNTLILVAIFALLAGYVYFVEMQKPAEDTQAKEKEKYVFTLGKDDVSTLQVKDGDKSVYLVKDSAGKWYIGGIGAAEADASRMDSIISSLTKPHYHGRLRRPGHVWIREAGHGGKPEYRWRQRPGGNPPGGR